MNVPAPHFLLFSESDRTAQRGQWRFVLESLDGTDKIEAADTEADIQGERLELLAVVRGLEALPQPSRVTLVTPSRYVNRGLNYGLAEWRSNDWQWEHFGEMAPVKNRDLWQRVDCALKFHAVDCRLWRFDGTEKKDLPVLRRDGGTAPLAGPHFALATEAASKAGAPEAEATPPEVGNVRRHRSASATVRSVPEAVTLSTVKSSKPVRIRRRLACQWRRIRVKLLRSLSELGESICLRLGQFGIRLAPPPWLD